MSSSPRAAASTVSGTPAPSRCASSPSCTTRSRSGPEVNIVHTDVVINVPPGTTPNYNANNPLRKLLGLIEGMQLACGREAYLTEHMQYLVPISDLTLYGPAGGDHNILDPTQQDNKTDFQKQNVEDFLTTDTLLIRGLVTAGGWTGPFL